MYFNPAGNSHNMIHDTAGKRLNDGLRSYTYDSRQRLVSLTASGKTTAYQYNGLGQRISKTGMLFMYDLDGHLLGEYDASGNAIQETVWLFDLPIATLRPNGAGAAIYPIHPDELGSPRVITDLSNQPVWRWDSDAFGNGAPNEDPRATGSKFTYNLRFPGQYFDKESGLHYNYFRDYDPGTGRYVQSDPIGLKGGVNTYVYTRGNPLTFADPTGESSSFLIGGVVLVVTLYKVTELIETFYNFNENIKNAIDANNNFSKNITACANGNINACNRATENRKDNISCTAEAAKTGIGIAY